MTSKFFLASAEEEITLELNRKEVQNEGFFSTFIDYPKEDKYNKGSFEIFYTCADNVSLKRLSQNGTPLSFPSNSIHKIKKDSKLLEFKDFSKNKNSVEIFINLYFREKDSNTPIEIINKSVIINLANYSSKNDSSDNNTGEITSYEITAGERIEYTIGFDKFIKNSEQTFTLNIDPTRNVNEKSKDNNIIKEDILFTTASSTEE